MVVWAVRYEPVSDRNSLLTGKLTGNFTISPRLEAVLVAKTPVLQRFSDAFPEKINREIIFDNREVCCTEQGNLQFTPVLSIDKVDAD